MTNNGNLKPWSCFKADGLNFNDYFLLLGFFNSLPLTWKKLMKDEGPVHIASSHSRNTELKFTLYLKDDTLSLNSITSPKLSWKLVQTIQIYPSARHKYTTLFNDCNLDWEAIYLIPHVVTLDTKTKIFQYKLLNRIIYTNKSLHKVKLTDSPLCSFCNISDESLEHLFCHCNFSIAFWRSVVLWLKTLHIDFDSDSLNDCDIIFGATQKKSHWLLLNHIIIVGKQLIYRNRLLKEFSFVFVSCHCQIELH